MCFHVSTDSFRDSGLYDYASVRHDCSNNPLHPIKLPIRIFFVSCDIKTRKR